jgi:hypothetical protein
MGSRWDRRRFAASHWGRWELVRVELVAESLVLDVLDVNGDAPAEAAEPMTVCVTPMPTDEGDPRVALCTMLDRWRVRDDGLCDVLRHGDDPYDFLALFQGAESVVLATVDGG